MVSAAYLSIPDNSGYFEYKDVTWKELPTVSGDVIIFPGWIEHRTQTNNSSEDRWVITTNFIAK
jgi:ectoine hydroxylase-related dioxygenase (phytanoyl-CoA dioxygenase family)